MSADLFGATRGSRTWRRRCLVAVLAGALVVSGMLPAGAQPQPSGPPNDDFGDAEPISGATGSTQAEMTGATEQSNEPEHTNNDFFPYQPSSPDPSVWFRWQAPTSGWYRFDVIENGEGECRYCSPSAVSVYSGSSLSALSRVSRWGNGIYEDHDDIAFFDSDGTGFVLATAGRSYAIAVAHVEDQSSLPVTATYDLRWKPDSPDLIMQVRLPDGRPARGWIVDADNPYAAPGYSHPRAYADRYGFVYYDLAPGEHRLEAREYEWWSTTSPNIAVGHRTITIPDDDDPLRLQWRLKAKPALDLDGDSRGDIVAGVPYADRGATNSGAVLVRFGNGRNRLLFQGGPGVPGPAQRGERFGASVQAVNVNRDSHTDLVIGAPGEMVNGVRTGAVFVVFGAPGGFGNGRATVRLHQNSAGVPARNRAGDAFGAAVQVRPSRYWTNFLVGAPGKDVRGAEGAGAVAYFTAFKKSSVRAPDPILWHQDVAGVGGSSVAGDRFGSALALGKFDEAHLGLAVGVPGKNGPGARNAGAIVVLRRFGEQGGSHPLLHQDSDVVPSDGRETGDAFGTALTRLSVDCSSGIGVDLLAVGAPGEGGGALHVLKSDLRKPQVFAPRNRNRMFRQGSGVVGGSSEAGDRFGAALGVGDFADDFADDLVVGAPGEDIAGAERAGAATVIALVGTPSEGDDYRCHWAPVRATRLRQGVLGVRGAPRAGSRFGAAVHAMDVNGDGHPDAVAGVPGDDYAARNAGALLTAQGGSGGFSGARGLHLTAPGAVAGDALGTVFGHRSWAP